MKKTSPMTKKRTYWVVDDALGSAIRQFEARLEAASSRLAMKEHQPERFEDEVDILKAGSFDGLIIDLRLGDVSNAKTKEKARYTAQGLAQELRSLMSRAEKRARFPSVPIVLWSTDRNIRNRYNKDDTAQDLFDAVYDKDDVRNNPAQYAAELVDLADGYETIGKSKAEVDASSDAQFAKVFGIKPDCIVDPRAVEAIALDTSRTEHQIARAVLKDLIGKSGPLVDEAVVAARLGVDRSKSSDWSKVEAKLKNCAYTGVFGNAWPRWWWHAVDEWWRKDMKAEADLMSMPADERVEHIKSTLKLKNLTAATPSRYNVSTKFWTVCQASGEPLDPAEGIRVNFPDREPWQSERYLSVNSILEGKARQKRLSIHPLDKERYESRKKRITS